MELELEGFTSGSQQTLARHVHPLWRITQDGSLRNGGIELITNGGLGGARLFEAFQRLSSGLERVDYDASFRCSTHMHINMLDFTIPQIVKFLLAYCACEPVLFQFCGTYRKSSNFCTPISESMPFHKRLISQMVDDCIATRRPVQVAVKYTALNVIPLFHTDRSPALGTLEFRGGRPLTTLDDMVTQANLLLSIKQFVRDHTGNEEEFLQTLGNGVVNTVYANGVAVALDTPVEELEVAMAHAWCLLKSYQEGKRHNSRASTPRTASTRSRTPDWVATEEAMADLMGPQPDPHPARRLNEDDIPFGVESWPSFFRLLGALSDNTNGSADEMYWPLVSESRSQLTEESKVSIYANWASRWPSGASLAQMIVNSRGHTGALPRAVFGVTPYALALGQRPGRINYRRILSAQAWTNLCSIMLLSASRTNGDIFNEFLRRKVRTKGRDSMRSRALFLGLREVAEWCTNNTNPSAAELFIVLRILGYNSRAHVFSSDYELYSRVAAAMGIMVERDLQVPILRDGRVRFYKARGGAGMFMGQIRPQSHEPNDVIGGYPVY